RRSRILSPFATPAEAGFADKRQTRFEPFNGAPRAPLSGLPVSCRLFARIKDEPPAISDRMSGSLLPVAGPRTARIPARAAGQAPARDILSGRRQGRRVDLQSRPHGRAQRNALDVVAFGTGRLGLDHRVGERTDILHDRLLVKRSLAH